MSLRIFGDSTENHVSEHQKHGHTQPDWKPNAGTRTKSIAAEFDELSARPRQGFRRSPSLPKYLLMFSLNRTSKVQW